MWQQSLSAMVALALPNPVCIMLDVQSTDSGVPNVGCLTTLSHFSSLYRMTEALSTWGLHFLPPLHPTSLHLGLQV